ncbi:PIN domain-containing protein [Pyxidicoccus parkwayensis]|uniref:PIN domain-containing protein n=1 Tax=Pyxidicoccus parkwayensis TaxID=2813578 RepID=A0ABX7NQV4_9BACT|nr:PIN domain-containing protein [Pyxidicoccus parkwaysis]QSQ21255.1 PIN domain-containing protein [Pyxidicoccus parkwaysis]
MLEATFSVVLDANVLIPVSLCDVLLRAARKRLIQIYWTEEILEEMRRNLVTDYGRTEAQAARRVAAMRDAFPEAMVTGYERLISAMTNHPKDRHVLAAAVHIGAQTIVTNNLRDFRAEHLPRSMQAQEPDSFLQNLLSQAPEAMLEILHLQAEQLKNPPISFEKMLDGMARSVPGFIQEVRALLPPPITNR